MEELINKVGELIEVVRCLFKRYDVITKFDVIVKDCDVISECNSISFENIGDVEAFIDYKYPLKVGDPSFIIPTQIPHKDTTIYRITFKGAGSNPRIIIIRKILGGQQ